MPTLVPIYADLQAVLALWCGHKLPAWHHHDCSTSSGPLRVKRTCWRAMESICRFAYSSHKGRKTEREKPFCVCSPCLRSDEYRLIILGLELLFSGGLVRPRAG